MDKGKDIPSSIIAVIELPIKIAESGSPDRIIIVNPLNASRK